MIFSYLTIELGVYDGELLSFVRVLAVLSVILTVNYGHADWFRNDSYPHYIVICDPNTF